MRKPCPRCAQVCLLRHVSPWFCYLVRVIPASLLFLQSFRALMMASKLAWNSLPPLCQLLLLSHGFSCSLILSFLCIGLCPLHLCIERTKNFFILYSPPLTHLDCPFTYPVTLAKTLFSGFSSADLSSWKGCFHIASSSSLCSHLPVATPRPQLSRLQMAVLPWNAGDIRWVVYCQEPDLLITKLRRLNKKKNIFPKLLLFSE